MTEYYVPGLYEGVWFILGAMVFSLLSKMMRVVKAAQLAQMTIIQSLWLMSHTVDDMNFIFEIKYKTMDDLDLGYDTVNISKELDKKLIEDWKKESIKKIRVAFPVIFKTKFFEFEDWEGAMDMIKKSSQK